MLKSMKGAALLISSMIITAGAANAADVTITISGVKAGEGALYVSLQTADQFMENEAAHATVIDDPGTGDVDVVFNGVEDGDYAASVWHDDDGNQKFDYAPQGWPLDGWAMSGAAVMGPPTFESAKVSVADDKVISLSMTYGRE